MAFLKNRKWLHLIIESQEIIFTVYFISLSTLDQQQFEVYLLLIANWQYIQMDIEKPTNKRKHVQWDEQKLQETEKNRGKYQKIIEPKTPYRRNSDDSIQEMDIETPKTAEQLQVEQSLKTAEKNRQTNKRGKIDLSALNAQLKQEMKKYHQPEEMEEEQSEQVRKKREQFKKKRANHYNQFKMIMQAKKHNWEDQEDD